MPLPSDPLTINGGCHCKAIRYRITIPAIDQRPLHPTLPSTTANNGSDCRQPYICICHCNSCRSASGAILPSWLCTPAEMIQVAYSTDPKKFRPGMEMLNPSLRTTDQETSGIKFYQSSPNIWRSFCGNCGTNISFYEKPTDSNGRDVIDICPGTIDRIDLEKEWMIPERQLFWDDGIEWIKRLTVGKVGMENAPKHPQGNVGEVVDT